MSNTVAKRSLFSKEEIGDVCDVPSSYRKHYNIVKRVGGF